MKAKYTKLLLSSVLLWVNTSSVHAQVNLLMDGGFDDTTANWSSFGGEGTLKYWHSLDSSIYTSEYIYFTTQPNVITSSRHLPNTSYFKTFPHSKWGTLQVLLMNDGQWPAGSNRGVARAKLRAPLVENMQYCITTYVRVSIVPAQIYTDGLRFYFDNGQLDTMVTKHFDINGIYPFVQPQFNAPILTDTSQWLKVQGSFTADSNQTYLTIGNFKTDANTVKQLPPWISSLANSCACSDVLLDDISVIPLDLHNWLADSYTTFGADSVWVGLDQYDYQDGKWYDINMNYLSTGPGFYLKNMEGGGQQFIQEVEVCGVLKYDTCMVYAYPTSTAQIAPQRVQLRIYPNPATEQIFVESTQAAQQRIALYNTLGELVQIQALHHKTAKFEVTSMPRGVYFVKCGAEVQRVVLR
jgi:hypothetical protein